MRMAAMTTIQSAYLLGGLLSFALAGVKLHLDQRAEVLYLEVHPDHERWALKEVAGIADELGYEIMPEWECPAEHLADGAVRHWLAEKEVVDDSGPFKAV